MVFDGDKLRLLQVNIQLLVFVGIGIAIELLPASWRYDIVSKCVGTLMTQQSCINSRKISF